MPEIEINVDDRTYRFACQAGEESHTIKLSRKLNERVSALRENSGLSNSALLVLAGLTLCDELEETISQTQQSSSTNVSEDNLQEKQTHDATAEIAVLKKQLQEQENIVISQNKALEQTTLHIENLSQTIEKLATKLIP